MSIKETQVLDRDTLNRSFVSKSATGTQIMAGSLTMLGSLNINGTLKAATLYEGGSALSSRYLGINAKAVDSDKLDNLDSSQFLRSDAPDELYLPNDSRYAYHLELGQPQGSAAHPISLRFHQGGRYYYRIMAKPGGFYLINGADDNYTNLHVNQLIASGDAAISGEIKATGNKIRFASTQSQNRIIFGDDTWGQTIGTESYYTTVNYGGPNSAGNGGKSGLKIFSGNNSGELVARIGTGRYDGNNLDSEFFGSITTAGNFEAHGEIKAGINNEFPNPLLASKTVGLWPNSARLTISFDSAQTPVGTGVNGSVKTVATEADGYSYSPYRYDVNAGDWITFSAYLFSTTSGKAAQLYIAWYNSSDSNIGHSVTSLTAPTAWGRYSVTAQAPANSRYFRVRLDNDGGSTTYSVSAVTDADATANTGSTPVVSAGVWKKTDTITFTINTGPALGTISSSAGVTYTATQDATTATLYHVSGNDGASFDLSISGAAAGDNWKFTVTQTVVTSTMYFSAFQVERGRAMTGFKPYQGGKNFSIAYDGTQSRIESETTILVNKDTNITGNLGINWNTPFTGVVVNHNSGTSVYTGRGAFGGLHFIQPANDDYYVGMTTSADTTPESTQGGILIQGSGSYGTKIRFMTTNSYANGMYERMVLDHHGNLGLGVVNPAHRLDVSGNINTSGNVSASGTLSVTSTSTLTGNVGIGAAPHGTYKLFVSGGVYSDTWIRTSGAAGWYSESYGGGIYMSDTTWIRTYGNKSFYHNAGEFRTDGTLQVGGSGATLNVVNNGSFNFRNTLWSDGVKVAVGKTWADHPLDVKTSITHQGINIQTNDDTLTNGLSFQNVGGTYSWHLARNGSTASPDLVLYGGSNATMSSLTERVRFRNGGGANFQGNVIVNGSSTLNHSPSITLALGDSDTGFNWNSDGNFDIKANNVTVANVTSGHLNIKSSTIASSNVNTAYYYDASIELREVNQAGALTGAWSEAPRLGFHWSGRVASQILMNTAGDICIVNNPGNGYEDFRALNVNAHGSLWTAGGLDADGKTHVLGASSSWDAVGFGNLTALQLQGHSMFWVGAGNGTWWSGTANSLGDPAEHDLLLTTHAATSTAHRGMTFAVATNTTGNGGYRLGKWYANTAANASNGSRLEVDGSLKVAEKIEVGSTKANARSNKTFSVEYNATEESLDFVFNG